MNKVVFDTLQANNTLSYNAFWQNLPHFRFCCHCSRTLPHPLSFLFLLFFRPGLSYLVVVVVVVARVWVVSDNIGEFNVDGNHFVWFWVLVAVILIVSMAGVSCQCRWSLLSWCGLLLGQGWVWIAVASLVLASIKINNEMYDMLLKKLKNNNNKKLKKKKKT